MNPQIRFGEDLMSRVSYVMMHPGSQGDLTRAVRGCLDELLGALVAEAGAERGDVLELTIVGNPIMHHLVLGLDPTELGGAPFALATDEAVRRTARELDLDASPGARVYVLPCIAGHVGADTAGMILSEAPHEQATVEPSGRRRHERRDRPRQPRPRCWRRRVRRGRRSRAPRSAAGSAPRRGRSNASESTPRRSSPGSP